MQNLNMKKSFIIFLILISFISYSKSDCGKSNGFVSDAFKADLVALVTIDSSYHHGHLLRIIEILRGNKLNSELILAWSTSECDTERDPIIGNKSDTLLVALFNQDEDNICDSKFISFVEKAGENVYHTQDCGTNILKLKDGLLRGQITKKVGTFIENGQSKFYPYQEESLPYSFLKNILAIVK
jgi:hypothetical protein